MSNKSFRKLPIVTFDDKHCDLTCPQLMGFHTKCKIDDRILRFEQHVNDDLPLLFLRTEECKRDEA